MAGKENEVLKSLVDNNVHPECQEMVQNMMRHPGYSSNYKWSPSDFEMGSFLGRGKFGRVYIARERFSQYMVAMKVMFKSEIKKGRVEKQILREIEIQTRLKHPNILRMFTWFHDESRIYLALELASHGELYRHLKNAPGGRFTEPKAAKYTYQVAAALNYCHANNVIHRDLKPENILLAEGDDIKLADFGWSAHTMSNKRKTLCGTLDYLPPEMVDGEAYNDSVDQWCLGILCYEFLVGSPPFESNDTKKTYEKIRSLDIHYPKHISIMAKDLISRLLCKHNQGRISLEKVMRHQWIRDNYLNLH